MAVNDKLLILPKIVEAQGSTDLPTAESLKQYNVKEHEIFDPSIREKKEIKLPTGVLDEEGNEVLQTKYVEVNRIAFPLQKLIVNRRVAFMNVGAMTIKSSPQTDKGKKLLAMVEKCREDNKLRYKSKDIAKRMMSELQVAELWYSEPVERGYWGDLSPSGVFRMRMRVLSPTLGDELLPVFNANGDLVYFGRKYSVSKDYTTEESDTTGSISKDDKVERFDIYSQELLYRFKKGQTGWELDGNPIKYEYGKMPIIYYSQPEPEWADVQWAINRIETAISNLGDTVDYNGSPILAVTGKIQGFASKGERGKVIEMDPAGDLKYVSWDQAPESVKLELDTLIDFVYTCTQTPNISFKEMKGLGTSGVAYDRIFMDAHLAAQSKIDDFFGEGQQRQLNFLKSACVAINNDLASEKELSMVPEIPLFKINDEKEEIEKVVSATAAGVMSKRTAISRIGATDNTEDELNQIKLEQPVIVKPTI